MNSYVNELQFGNFTRKELTDDTMIVNNVWNTITQHRFHLSRLTDLITSLFTENKLHRNGSEWKVEQPDA